MIFRRYDLSIRNVFVSNETRWPQISFALKFLKYLAPVYLQLAVRTFKSVFIGC